MIILTIRSDKPEAEIGLHQNHTELVYKKWPAHRQLAETIHQQITDLLTIQGTTLEKLEGIVVFRGPGSFTGLRIGISVANALAYSLDVPIVGSQDKWIEIGIKALLAGESDNVVTAEYGAPVHTTVPKK